MRGATPLEPQTIDEYLSLVSKEQRAALEKLRSAIPGGCGCLAAPLFDSLAGNSCAWYTLA